MANDNESKLSKRTHFFLQSYFFFLIRLNRGIQPLGKERTTAGLWWLMPINLATWEAEIRRIVVRGQAGK
jgi:hypothetical protein